jgi:hypothetical protein
MQIALDAAFRLHFTATELSLIGRALEQFAVNNRNQEAGRLNRRMQEQRVFLLTEALEQAEQTAARLDDESA